MDYFKPYEGDEPFIFISYAHADQDAVMKVVGDMHDRGYNIWYDEGIEVGSEWPECIAEHLNRAHLVLAFISNAYMRSDNCRREMHFTLSKKKKIINIFLESTEMTPGMEMQIGNIFALMKFAMTDAVLFEKLYSAPLLNSEHFIGAGAQTAEKKHRPADKLREEMERRRQELERHREELALRKETLAVEKAEAKAKRRKHRKRRLLIFLAVFVLLLAGAVTMGVIAYTTGWGERLLTQPVQVSPLSGGLTAQFSDPLLESAAREFAGIPEGELRVSDLEGLTSLYIRGGSCYFSREDMEADTTPPALGAVGTLDDLKYFTRLDILYLEAQPLSSLDSLPAANIEELSLIDCGLMSLEGISRLPKLRSLTTDGSPVNELGDINRCLKLKKLSLIGSNVSDYTALKPLVKLVDFSSSNCDIDELYTVCHMSAITSISLYDSDLRGRFFKAFDRERTLVSMKLVNCELDATINVEDFRGLTELYLSGTGANLDWTALTLLPALKRVYVDADMLEGMTQTLSGTAATVTAIA